MGTRPSYSEIRAFLDVHGFESRVMREMYGIYVGWILDHVIAATTDLALECLRFGRGILHRPNVKFPPPHHYVADFGGIIQTDTSLSIEGNQTDISGISDQSEVFYVELITRFGTHEKRHLWIIPLK